MSLDLKANKLVNKEVTIQYKNFSIDLKNFTGFKYYQNIKNCL